MTLPGALAPGESLAFGRLLSLEGCAARWALGRACDVSGRAIYPITASDDYPFLRGRAVHAAVHRILSGTRGPFELRRAIDAAGGVERILDAAFEETLQPLIESWRVAPDTVRIVRHELVGRWGSEIRLATLQLVRHAAPRAPIHGEAPAHGPYALSEPTVNVMLADGAWTGHPDLVEVHGGEVCITDFKTDADGDEVERHDEQLITYAALWRAARGGNSFTLRIVRRVGIVRELRVDGTTLDAHVRRLEKRGFAARQAGSAPVATPNAGCGSCRVRAGCERYWEQHRPGGKGWVDVELRVESMWDPLLGSLYGTALRSPDVPLRGGERIRVDAKGALARKLAEAKPTSVLRLLRFRQLDAAHGLWVSADECTLRSGLRGSETWRVEETTSVK